MGKMFEERYLDFIPSQSVNKVTWQDFDTVCDSSKCGKIVL